jgi:hypothetical protein
LSKAYTYLRLPLLAISNAPPRMSGKKSVMGELERVAGTVFLRVGPEEKGSPNVSEVEVRVESDGSLILEDEACLSNYEIGKTVFVRGQRPWRLHWSTVFASLEWRDEGTEYQLRFPTLQERDMVWEVIQNHLRYQVVTAWTELHLKKVQVMMDGIQKSGESNVVEEKITMIARHAVAAEIGLEHGEDENMEVDVEAKAEDAKAALCQGRWAVSRRSTDNSCESVGRTAPRYGNQSRVWDPGISLVLR